MRLPARFIRPGALSGVDLKRGASMGNPSTVVIGMLVIIVIILGGYGLMVTREAGAKAERIKDQAAQIEALDTEIRVKAQQIQQSEASLRQFKASRENLIRVHQDETRSLQETIDGLTKAEAQRDAALKERAAETARLKEAIARQARTLHRMQQDRDSDRQKQTDLQTTIQRLREELSANELIILELKNDREAIACLERTVPDIVLDRMLGDGVRPRPDNQN